MVEKFDAIVVGAGPAGVTAAYVMAKSRINVAIIERGEYPGSKNVIGGVLYIKTLDDVSPGFWSDAPLERRIVQHSYCLMGKGEHTIVSHVSTGHIDTASGYTILRSKFDRWYLKKAQEAGATVITKTNVTELLSNQGRTVGARTDRGDLSADIVVVAEGANTMLCEKAGLITKPRADQMAVAVKEIVALPSDKIQERFTLNEGEGTAIHYIGALCEGLVGFGFVYTNKESLSVGFGAIISTMMRKRIKPYDLIEKFKQEPSVEPFLRDGVVKEYQAHMIPEAGYVGMPRLYSDGVLVVGDSAMLANPVTGEGADLAILSGRLAGEVAMQAHMSGDYTSRTLVQYQRLLSSSFAVRDMKKQSGLLDYIEENPEIMSTYPEVINAALGIWFKVDGSTRAEKLRRIRSFATSKRGITKIMKDMYVFGRKLM
ncbi:MAG: FAD-dependent oxidoreductase [Candidatus Bathyarchaeia archaeon]